MEEDLALVDRLVGILICHGLNDELALNLEEDVVSSQWTLTLRLLISKFFRVRGLESKSVVALEGRG